MIRGSDVTVLIPTIEGREALLERALASVTRQQVKPAHVVVQLDRERVGAAGCRNLGLTHVDTEFVAFLDDDDEMLPNHLKVLVRGANSSHADLIFTYPEFVGGTDSLACINDAGEWIMAPVHVPFHAAQRLALRKYGNFIPCGYLVRTARIRAVGGFPEPYSMPEVPVSRSGDCEDYLMLLKLLDAGAEFHHVCGVRTWRYNLHGANLGGRGLDRMHELQDH